MTLLPSALEVTEVDRQSARDYEHLRAPEVYAASFRLVEPYFLGRRTLDLGCGTGVYLKRLAPGSVGIDYSVPNLRESQSIGLSVIRCDLNDRLPFANGSFEGVLISHTLEHVDAPIRLLREAARVLMPGGVLAIALPFERSLVRLALRDDYFRGHPTHFYSFSVPCLDQLTSACGLRRIRIVLDPPLIRRLRIWPVLNFFQVLPFSIARWFCGNFWYLARKAGT
ncbi:MAG TPA: class I SAM-dependent methyltransferase [Candidatus Polarisedimenticolia bacterium]|jgi:SAM-dependent methyltransferase|nr:class I SAM-dependent methyltransferase [Candidatus Polarisedimenticolia bacterium]